MTTQEFSNEFDILYNNIMSNAAPGLTEYEKSVFLNKAQSEVIVAYFSNKGNKFQEGFDDSEKRQYDFSSLIITSNLPEITDEGIISSINKLDRRSKLFSFPVGYFLSVNELISDCTKFYSVIPLKHEEYQRLMLKPYAYPVKRGAWRMFTNTLTVRDNDNKETQVPVAEIVGRFSGPITYQLRYVRKPKPIILEDLGEELSIDGVHTKSECELSSELHSEILQRAVELAKAAYIGDLNSQIALGQTSETNMGIVAQSR